MEITEQKLKDRLDELDEQERQALSTLQAIFGAKQEVMFWLAKLKNDTK